MNETDELALKLWLDVCTMLADHGPQEAALEYAHRLREAWGKQHESIGAINGWRNSPANKTIDWFRNMAEVPNGTLLYLAPVAQVSDAKDAKEQSAWLIESKFKHTGPPNWWGCRKGFIEAWTCDPNSVVRFARKEDAELAMKIADIHMGVATEHMWLDAALAAAEAK